MGQSVKPRLLARVSVCAETGCWNWPISKNKRYGQISVGKKMRLAHRVSYELHCGPITDGLHVCHRCDNPACINPEHLFLGTQAENMADRNAKGRQARLRGAVNGRAKLSEADVLAIRAGLAEGVSQRKLAARHGVHPKQISRIRSGGGWSHLT
jgi:hypothetical protein